MDEQVIACLLVVSYVRRCAALIGLNDVFKGKKLKGNKVEETELSKGQIDLSDVTRLFVKKKTPALRNPLTTYPLITILVSLQALQ